MAGLGWLWPAVPTLTEVVTKNPYHHGINLTSDFRFLFLAVLGPEIGPDRRNFESYCVLDRNFTVASRPGPFRPTFALPAKSAPAKITNFV